MTESTDALGTGEPFKRRGRRAVIDDGGPNAVGQGETPPSTRAPSSLAPTSRRLLRSLLTRHRQQLSRADVGLPTQRWRPAGRRLSQEDLAQLTGLGIGVIQRLEAGTGHPDVSALDAVAAALRMAPECRQALYLLARRHPAPPLTFATGRDPSLEEFIQQFNGPAVVVDAVFTVLSRNDHARRWLPGCGDSEPNFARWLAQPLATQPDDGWCEIAAMIMVRLRQLALQFPNNAEVTNLLRELRRHAALHENCQHDNDCYRSPAALPVQILVPAHPDRAHPDDPPARENALLVVLRSLRPDDGRCVIAFTVTDRTAPDRIPSNARSPVGHR
jgi:transcriptional regulator with XRE-family HTH domain